MPLTGRDHQPNPDTWTKSPLKLIPIQKMEKYGAIFLILFLSISTISSTPVGETTTSPDDVEETTPSLGNEEIIFRVEEDTPTPGPNVTAPVLVLIIPETHKQTPLPSEGVRDPLRDVIVVFRQEGEEEEEEDESEEEGEVVVEALPTSSTSTPPPSPEQEQNISPPVPERPRPSKIPANPAAAEESPLENFPPPSSPNPSEGDEVPETPEEPPRPPPRPVQPVQEGILPIQEPGIFTRRPKPTPPTEFLPPQVLNPPEVEAVPGIPIEENPGAAIKKPVAPSPALAPVPQEPIAVLPPPSGKYKIKPKPTPVPIGVQVPAKPTSPTDPPASISDEWNITNSIFTLSPQGRAACECGKTPFKLDNAERTGLNEYPWAVAVVRAGIFGGGRPHCGGVLINNLYVLSSASCFESLYADGIQVWLTAHNSLQAIDNSGVHSDRVIKRDVREILMHPNYERRSHDNDIALVKLSHPVDISTSSYYVPACLPAGLATYDGMTGRVMGWGSPPVGPNRYAPNKMCKEDIPVIANSVCNRDTSHRNKITSNQMCAGFLTKVATETCIGDAGGPLMLPNNGRYTLIGLVSFGFTNRQAYTPVVYTRVNTYADWILHNTEDADWCSL